MKFIINKRSIILLIVSFLSLLLVLFGIFFKDRIIQIINSKTLYNLDKYSELLKDCEIETNNGVLELHCIAVLKRMEIKEEEDCILTEVLVNGNKNLRESYFCVQKDKIDWENPYEIDNASLVVKMDMVYKKEKNFDYSFDEIILAVLDESELSKLYEINSELKKIRPSILSEKFAENIKNNYNKLDKISIGETSISHVLFYKLILKSVTVNNSKLELLFEGEIKGQVYGALFKSNRFFIIEGVNHKIISPEDYSDLKNNQEYDLMTVSIDSVFPQSMKERCFKMEGTIPQKGIVSVELLSKEFFPLCVVLPDNLENMYVPDVEKYIGSSIEESKANSDYKILNLEKLLPFSILPL